ncbi:MAG: PTS glucitol/sorbitol transporter subunit IIA [Pelolinea sp.]|nr:PTS glucitol/sorbitol transporter subunit IIA [Pelolinea sp.]
MVKYTATVTQIGPLVEEFINAGILVFFGEGAPPELVEFSIIHNGRDLKKDLVPDDVIFIDDQEYKVLAVGEVANSNFRNLGHLIMKFNGKEKVELPGDVCVENKPIPPIKVGSTIKVLGN